MTRLKKTCRQDYRYYKIRHMRSQYHFTKAAAHAFAARFYQYKESGIV
ncbi:MAG: hypothetical protein ACLU4J_14845 [Butyricimonas paravirosa]